MAKSYYAILGISSMASADEIRAAYRRLAKAYHPDHYEGGSETFRQVQEAYSVLGNAERRRQYEKSIHRIPVGRSSARTAGVQPEPLIPKKPSGQVESITPLNAHPSDARYADSFFDLLWRNFNSLLSPGPGPVTPLSLAVTITRQQANQGGTVTVAVPALSGCPSCDGYGRIGRYACSTCAGEGSISGELPLAISFPAGIRDNDEIVLDLDRFGMKNHQVSIFFRIAKAAPWGG